MILLLVSCLVFSSINAVTLLRLLTLPDEAPLRSTSLCVVLKIGFVKFEKSQKTSFYKTNP